MANYLDLPIGGLARSFECNDRNSGRGSKQIRIRQETPCVPAGPNFVFAGALSGRLRVFSSDSRCRRRSADMLVLVDTPSFSGCLMKVRPIGLLLEMLDQGVKDQKILAVSRHNPRYREVHILECHRFQDNAKQQPAQCGDEAKSDSPLVNGHSRPPS